MLKRILLSTVALTMVAGSALAADLSARPRANVVKAPMMTPASTWTGCYIGGHGGYGWGTFDNAESGSIDADGAVAGGQVGCDWQYDSNWVFGVAGSGSWSDITTSEDDSSADLKWFVTATARLGYSFGPGLLYVKGGAAWAKNEYTFSVLSADETRFGWTVGAGLEYMFAPNWSMFVEYNYMDFGRDDVNFGTESTTIDQDVHLVKAGINFRFGGGPVVAKY